MLVQSGVGLTTELAVDLVHAATLSGQTARREQQLVGIALTGQAGSGKGLADGVVTPLFVNTVLIIEVQGAGTGLAGQLQQQCRAVAPGVGMQNLQWYVPL